MIRALSILFALLTASALAADDVTLPTEKLRIPHSLVDIELIKIPAGTIEMPTLDKQGQPLPDGSKHVVQIKSIWVEKTELPWEAFDIWAFCLDLTDREKQLGMDQTMNLPMAESRPSGEYGAPDRGFGHQGYPAISVNYAGANMYCRWLSAHTGKKFRLPTEAEWEYACRAGGRAQKLDAKTLAQVAWFADNSVIDNGDRQTRPVGAKLPNAWGFHDMLGNVWEWSTITDKLGVVKGGSYQDQPDDVHDVARSLYRAEWQFRDPTEPKCKWWLSDGPHIGFRIVREE